MSLRFLIPGVLVLLIVLAGSDVALASASRESGPVAVPQPSALAVRHYRSGNWLWLAGEAWALAVPALLLATGTSAKMRDLARVLGGSWFFSIGFYAVFYVAITALLNLPLAYYAGFVRQHAYGLSRQTHARWFEHWAIGHAIAMAIGFLFLWIPYLFLARSRRWWLYCGLLTVPFLFFSVLVKPIWFDPLLNRFGPMHDKALERKILALAYRAGIDGGRVHEVDKSRDTKTVNAYVTGMLGTKRIVLWDTLLQKLDEDEVLVVMGHEMGHYVLGHLALGIAVSAALATVGFWFSNRAGLGILKRKGGRFGFDRLSDVASVPLLVLLGHVYSLGAVPVGNAFSRHQEHEADRFALEITRANHSAGMAFVKLQRENLSNPRPDWYYTLWRGSHPSLGDRIDFANAYHPWLAGRPLRYASLFRDPPAAVEPPTGATGPRIPEAGTIPDASTP